MALTNRYGVMAINITSTLVLARLLTPAQTGLFSVTASIFYLAQVLRDFGIAEFLVQEKDLTPVKIRTAFGSTLIVSWLLGIVVFSSRGWIAGIYATPKLVDLIGVASVSFLVTPFSSTVLALLNREMAFDVMLRISLSSNFVNAIISISLSYLGWGAMGLTIGMVAMNVTTAVVAGFSARSHDHFIPSLREWRQIIAFGSYMSAINVINQVSLRAPDLVIGRALGYASLGIYNRALGTVRLFSDLVASSVQAVVFPSFSALHRTGADLCQPYLRVVAMTNGISLPVLALLAITAHPMIEVLLGPQWLAAIPLVPYMVAAVAIDALAPMTAPVLTAVGQVALILRLTAVTRTLQVIGIIAFAPFGLHWVVRVQIATSVIGFAVNAGGLRHRLGLRMGQLLLASSRSAVLAVWTILPAASVALVRTGVNRPAVLTLLLSYTLGAVAWLAGVFVLRHPFSDEILSLLRTARGMLRRNFGISV